MVLLLLTPDQLAQYERRFLDQKTHVNDLIFAHKNRNRENIRQMCAGNTQQAKKNFWSVINPKVKQSTDISAVIDPDNGALKCSTDEIKTAVEDRFCHVFQGSREPLPPDPLIPPAPNIVNDVVSDNEHNYSKKLPVLQNLNSSGELLTDPNGWINRPFCLNEVKEVLKTLNSGKASGWDTIPNEFSRYCFFLACCFIQQNQD